MAKPKVSGKGLKKSKFNLFAIFASLAVIYVLYRLVVSKSKGASESMGSQMYMGSTTNPTQLNQQVKEAADSAPAQPASPDVNNIMSSFAQVNGIQGTTQGLPPTCNSAPTLQADQLLPNDSNSDFQQLAPNGGGALAGVNLLQAGHHNGIDTVSSALRNANLQLRSEPPNPTKKVSPWNETTIQPDLMRVPLEIGCGPQ